MKTLLIVDDMETNVETLMGLLEDQYDIIATLDGNEALEIVREEHVDMILLDIMMPGIDGFEVCRRLKADERTAKIPIIFITAKTDEDSIEEAYLLGGVDYITKPFKAREILSRIRNHLALSEQSILLEDLVKEKTKELYELSKEIEYTQKEVIFTLSEIVEHRSKETSNHVKRVAEYSKILALGYGMNEKEADLIKHSSPMHDIGKVAIPDAILNKPGKLTKEEFEKIKEHSSIGFDMLKHSERSLVKAASIIAYEHHEKWSGNGYPRGLKGENIHIYGRITALADVFDALGSYRVYKRAWDDEKIFALFREESGKHFEPKIIEIFFNNVDKFLKIRASLQDRIG